MHLLLARRALAPLTRRVPRAAVRTGIRLLSTESAQTPAPTTPPQTTTARPAWKSRAKKTDTPMPAQVTDMATKLEDVATNGLTTEAYELLDKAIEFLRRVPEVRRVHLLEAFLVSGLRLVERLETPLPRDVVELLKRRQVAHVLHYLAWAQRLVAEGLYDEALRVWAEYRLDTLRYLRRWVSTAPQYAYLDLQKATYAAYLLRCKREQEAPDTSLAKELLAMDSLPSWYQMRTYMLNGSHPDKVHAKSVLAICQELQDTLIDAVPRLVQRAFLAAGEDQPRVVRFLWEKVNKIAEQAPLDMDVYRQFMKFFIHTNALEDAYSVFDLCIGSGATPSAGVFAQAMDAVAKDNRVVGDDKVKRVETIRASMVQAGVEVTDEIHASMIDAYSKAKRNGDCARLYKEHSEEALVRDAYMVHLIRANQAPEAAKLFEALTGKDGYVPQPRVVNAFVKYQLSRGKFDSVSKWLDRLAELGGKPDEATYTMTVDTIFKTAAAAGTKPDLELVWRLLDEMESNGLRNDVFTLTTIIDGLLKSSGDITAARAIWDYMKDFKKYKPTKTTYTVMINGEFRHGDPARAEALYADLEAYHQLTTAISNVMVIQYGQKHNMDKMLHYYTKMKELGQVLQQPNKYTYLFMVQSAREAERADVVNRVAADYAKRFDEPNGAFVRELVRSRRMLTRENLDKFKLKAKETAAA